MADEKRILRTQLIGSSPAAPRPIAAGIWILAVAAIVCGPLLCRTAQAQFIESRSMVFQQTSHHGWGGGWRTTGIATYGPGLYAGTWYGPWGYPSPWGNNYVAAQYSAYWNGGYPPSYMGYGYNTGAFDFVPAVYSVQRYRLGMAADPLALPLMDQGVQGGGRLVDLQNPGVGNANAPAANAPAGRAGAANLGPQANPRPLAELLPKGAEEATPAPGSSLQARQRAGYFVRSGDRLFQQQRYQESLARYKDAAIAASDQGEPHLRKGLAYAATNRPEYAVKSLRRALENDPAVLEKAPSLDELLGGNEAAKSSLIESVARRAVDDPDDADLLFVVACVLMLDGQAEAAERYLGHVERLTGQPMPFQAQPVAAGEAGAGGIDL